MMATQSKRGPAVEPAEVSEPGATADEFVGTPVSADDQSTVECRQQLAEQLLAKAQTDGVRLVGPDGLLAG